MREIDKAVKELKNQNALELVMDPTILRQGLVPEERGQEQEHQHYFPPYPTILRGRAGPSVEQQHWEH